MKNAAGSGRNTGAIANDTGRTGNAAATSLRRKLSFKEQRELEALPARIEALEAEQARLGAEVSAPEFYRKPASDIHGAMSRLEALPAEIETALRRWDELETVAQAARSS